MLRVQDIRELFVKEYNDKNFVIDKTGIKTIELIGHSFIADEEYIFGLPNHDYIKREIDWYKSMSLNVNDLENTPKIWKQVADKDGYINSNYGWCIYSEYNGYQYVNCLNELLNNKDTRRAVMIYNRPSMWKDYNFNGRSDFMCTHAVQYFIRNDKLISYVLMRSMDSWAGYRNDYAWQQYVHKELSKKLDIEQGEMYWTSGSTHLYERQFYLMEEYITNKNK